MIESSVTEITLSSGDTMYLGVQNDGQVIGVAIGEGLNMNIMSVALTLDELKSIASQMRFIEP